MLELTSAQYRFRTAVPEGDLYEALGLSPKATSLDVDVAGARLAEQVPAMAQEVSRVVNVLTHRQRKTLYDAVRKIRDEAAESLDTRYGLEFRRSIPNVRRELWDRCCRLFRFDLAIEEQKLGDNGRQELAVVAPGWIVHEFLDARVNRLSFAEHERESRRAQRDAWHAKCRCRDTSRLFFTLRGRATSKNGGETEPPELFKITDYMYWQATCPRCRQKYEPTVFDDRYEFTLPAKLTRGDLVRGEAVWGGGPAFAIVGSPCGNAAPKDLLDRFFKLQNEGKDVGLEETEKDLCKRPPVVAKPLKSSKPAPSGNFPWWLIGVFGVLLSSVFRNLSDNHSPQWQTPPTHWTPPSAKSPDVRPNRTVPEYDFSPKPSASPPRSSGAPKHGL